MDQQEDNAEGSREQVKVKEPPGCLSIGSRSFIGDQLFHTGGPSIYATELHTLSVTYFLIVWLSSYMRKPRKIGLRSAQLNLHTYIHFCPKKMLVLCHQPVKILQGPHILPNGFPSVQPSDESAGTLTSQPNPTWLREQQ